MPKPAKPIIPKTPFSFRKHIVPPFVGLLVMGSVMAMLNVEYLMAQSRYHFASPARLAVTAPAPNPLPLSEQFQPDPGAPARLTISAIGIDAPIVFDEPSVAESKVQLALRRGVVHYGETAVPGQDQGNVVILGHSSGRPWAPGDYKWVFTLLDKLKAGDQISISYQGLPYVYTVTDLSVVEPENISVLNQTDRPSLTLITCTPVGTNKQRLIVRAVQTSPTVSSKQIQEKRQSTRPTVIEQPEALPGQDASASIWQTIKNWF